MTARPLRLLLVEDSERDAAHVTLALRRGGWAPQIRRVETRDEMAEALRDGVWDAIVSDYNLPRFNAPDALATLQESGLDIPFIVVSGEVGEDTAVRLMASGASDYLLKDRMTRLNAALERELEQAQER
ncbi:MAG TPA: response regulator, partial [Thermoanaerobaculia bacterium]|nr:response regulator [Thermoanaerobaculia bacterium]